MEEVLDQFVEDVETKRELKRRFQTYLEKEESKLSLEIQNERDPHVVYNKIKESKRRLEDVCIQGKYKYHINTSRVFNT